MTIQQMVDQGWFTWLDLLNLADRNGIINGPLLFTFLRHALAAHQPQGGPE